VTASVSVQYLAALDERLTGFFDDQASGLDIPPAVLYRLEGFIEAGILSSFISETEIKSRLVKLAGRYLGDDSAALYRDDERLVLHLRMHEAPVYPSKVD
jgi:hypothetical protein